MKQAKLRLARAISIVALATAALFMLVSIEAHALAGDGQMPDADSLLSDPVQADGPDDITPWSDALPWQPTDIGLASDLDVPQADDPGIVSDDFNACELNTDLWTFTDPKNAGADYETDGQRLQITVPAGTDYNLWADANFAPRVMQPVANAPFQVEAKFESELNAQYQMQGIIAETGVGGILRFGFFSSVTKPSGQPPVPHVWVFAAVIRTDTDPHKKVQVVKKEIFPTGTDLYMRVEREYVDGVGWRWVQEYSFNGVNWAAAGTDAGVDFINNLTPAQVGVYAGSTVAAGGDVSNAPGHTAIVDYFFRTDAPINPEDPKGYTVTTNTSGQGSIEIDPVGPTYVCDEPLTFTAVQATGWEFDNWSGDVTGTASPTSANFDMGMDVTAAFVESLVPTYTLDINIGTGMGSVTKDPDLSVYEEGQQVQLTAVPDSGYDFSTWGGDVTGPTNPITVTMTSDKSVTANFTEIVPEGFTLDISNIFGNGDVNIDPEKAIYAPDEQVTLTAVPDLGWSFAGWGGDAAGTDLVITLTMDGDKVVLATFTEDAYNLNVNHTGEGDINVEPQQATYKYGDEVTLTATPADNWKFDGWSGNLTGTDNPATYTITGDTVIKALFVSTTTKVYLPLIQK